MKEQFFDFSRLEPRQQITYIINKQALPAIVVAVTPDTVECFVGDGYSAFDRASGVHLEGPENGFLINKEYRHEDDYGEMVRLQAFAMLQYPIHRDTRAAIQLALLPVIAPVHTE